MTHVTHEEKIVAEMAAAAQVMADEMDKSAGCMPNDAWYESRNDFEKAKRAYEDMIGWREPNWWKSAN